MSSSTGDSDTVRWGMIGCGNVTEVKSGPAFNKVPHSKMVTVMRRDGVKAEDYAKRHGIANWSDNADDILEKNPDINSVYVATPPSSHKEYVLKAISRGLNVYVEKPIAMNTQEVMEIQSAMTQTSSKLTVAHYRRGLPMFARVKEMLDNGSIGTLRCCTLRCWKYSSAKDADPSNWRLDPAVSGGGYFHDLAPHQLDVMLMFFGHPERIPEYAGVSCAHDDETINAKARADDTVSGVAMFPRGVAFSGSWCFQVPQEEAVDECVIVGSTGSIRFPFFGPRGTVTIKRAGQPTVTEDFEHPEHIQQPMIEKVVNYFRSDSASAPSAGAAANVETASAAAPNPCSIDEALVCMRLMDAFTAK